MPLSSLIRSRRATEERQAIIRLLGGRCALCGEGRMYCLEIDHPKGRDYAIEKLAPWQRVKRWGQELSRGELRVLCRKCNAQEGGGRRNGTLTKRGDA